MVQYYFGISSVSCKLPHFVQLIFFPSSERLHKGKKCKNDFTTNSVYSIKSSPKPIKTCLCDIWKLRFFGNFQQKVPTEKAPSPASLLLAPYCMYRGSVFLGFFLCSNTRTHQLRPSCRTIILCLVWLICPSPLQTLGVYLRPKN